MNVNLIVSKQEILLCFEIPSNNNKRLKLFLPHLRYELITFRLLIKHSFIQQNSLLFSKTNKFSNIVYLFYIKISKDTCNIIKIHLKRGVNQIIINCNAIRR